MKAPRDERRYVVAPVRCRGEDRIVTVSRHDRGDLEALRRVRAICHGFVGVDEGQLQGRPLFRVGRRRFAIFNGATSPPRRRWHGCGRSLHFLADEVEVEALRQDGRFAASPHHGDRRWLFLRLEDSGTDWSEVAELLEAAYAQVGPRATREQAMGGPGDAILGRVLFGPAVRVPADATAADWVAAGVGPFGTVGGLVPEGFDEHLLLDYRGEEPLGWDGVADLFEELSDVLVAHTSSPDRCWFAIWEGYGWDTSMTLIAVDRPEEVVDLELERERRRVREADLRRNAAVRAARATLPAFDLPNRRYYLLHGPVTASAAIEQPGSDGFVQAPDLWWPDDRQWFVGGDTDLDWCYIAGSHVVTEAIRAAFPQRTMSVDRAATNAFVGGLRRG